MLIECKNDKEKVAMGLLSYLPDFKNLANLKDEIQLNKNSTEFCLYLYRSKVPNFIGVIGTQISKHFVIIRYLSFAPDYRQAKYEARAVQELAQNSPSKVITAVPEYIYLIKYLKKGTKNE